MLSGHRSTGTVIIQDPTAQGAVQRVKELEVQVARLSLICEALWEIVRDRDNLAHDLLNLKVADIDLRDGHLDGRKRAAAAPRACPKCKKTLQVTSQRCIYCGTFDADGSVFKPV
jgi:hypothetical protein